MPFELTAAGLSTPRFPEARALVVEKWKARFGDNAQTAEDTPDGLEITVIALMLALAWEGLADMHAGSYFRTSSGTAVDLILDLFGRRRLAAAASTASAVWYGEAGTSVVDTAAASVEDTGARFGVDAAGVTTTAGAGGPIVVRVLQAVEGSTYAIDVDTTTESTVVAGAGDTVADIADALAVQLAADNPTATVARGGEDPDGVAVIVLEDLGAGVVTVGPSATTPAHTAVRFGVRLDMTADETGPIAALAGTLNTIETPAIGLEGVCSTADAELGRNVETDTEFRDRHLDQINSGGAGSPEAIRARVLAIEGMRYVRVFENETDTVDSAGRPAHSFELVWVGPEGAATEALVAAAIFAAKPAGIQAYGSTTTVVLDSLGNPHSIGHSRGTVRYLHLDVTIVPGEGYPTTGDPLAAIEAAIVQYLGEDGDGELGLGQDFYRFALGRPIGTAVDGVASATVLADDTANPGDPPTLVGSDIAVGESEILDVDSSRVSVHL